MIKADEKVSLKEKLSTLLVLGLIAIVVIIIYMLGRPPKIGVSKFAIGEIIGFSYSGGASGRDANVAFLSNDKKILCYTYGINGMVLGDKFSVEYEVDDPQKCIVHTELPIFLDTEKTNTIIASIVQIDDYDVRYKYTIAGNDYLRFQKYDNKKIAPTEGELYLIKYWVENPQRAIIFLDKPINDSTNAK